MKTTEQRIEEIKTQGYDIDFGTVFNDAFETWKKTALMSGLALLVFSIVIGGLAIGVIMIMGGFSAYSNFATGLATDEFSIVQTLAYLITMCAIAGLANPFTAGLIKMAHQADKGEDVSIGDAFQCYKQPYFVPLFLEAVIVSAVSISVTTGIQMAQPYNMAVPFFNFFINLFITFMACMAVPFILFGNANAMTAIRGSFVVVSKNFFWLALLALVAYLLGFVGLVAFCIGALFTAPFVYNMYFAIYKHAVGLTEKSEIDEIGQEDIF